MVLLLWFLALDGVLSGALLSIPVVLARQPVYIGSGSNAREYAAVQHSVGLSNRISWQSCVWTLRVGKDEQCRWKLYELQRGILLEFR